MPNITYGVGFISRFMESLISSDLVAANRTLRYIKTTLDYGLLFPNNSDDAKSRIRGHLILISLEIKQTERAQ